MEATQRTSFQPGSPRRRLLWDKTDFGEQTGTQGLVKAARSPFTDVGIASSLRYLNISAVATPLRDFGGARHSP